MRLLVRRAKSIQDIQGMDDSRGRWALDTATEIQQYLAREKSESKPCGYDNLAIRYFRLTNYRRMEMAVYTYEHRYPSLRGPSDPSGASIDEAAAQAMTLFRFDIGAVYGFGCLDWELGCGCAVVQLRANEARIIFIGEGAPEIAMGSILQARRIWRNLLPEGWRDWSEVVNLKEDEPW